MNDGSYFIEVLINNELNTTLENFKFQVLKNQRLIKKI